MKNILKISAFLFLLILGSASELSAQDQKFGHLNAKELIILLPEAKAADAQLATYQEQLGKDFEAKIVKFQADVAVFEKEAPNLSQVKIQERSADLQKRQQDLQKEEYELPRKVDIKRNELLQPILEKIDVAIKAVGKEKGYTMIFDSSGMNVMLYNQPSQDVMSLVKAKLNL